MYSLSLEVSPASKESIFLLDSPISEMSHNSPCLSLERHMVIHLGCFFPPPYSQDLHICFVHQKLLILVAFDAVMNFLPFNSTFPYLVVLLLVKYDNR